MNLFDVLFAKKLSGGGSPFPPVIKRVTGNPIEFSDGADAPLVKCVTQITGSQDLHGQDKPWVGGAYINKMPPGEAKSTSDNGVTITSDGNGTYTFVGTCTQDFEVTFDCDNFTIPSADNSAVYLFNSEANVNTVFVFYNGTTVVDTWSLSPVNRVSTYTGMKGLPCNKYGMRLKSGVAYNLTFIPMIAVGTSYTEWYPYSNICPITAYTDGEIEVRGKNALNNADAEIGTAWNGGSNSARARLVVKKDPYTPYVISMNGTNGMDAIYVKRYSSVPASDAGTQITSFPVTIPATDDNTFLIFAFSKTAISQTDVDNLKLQVEKGTTVTTYEPYTSTTHTTTYPSAIYRGSEDCVKGEVTEEYAYINLGSLTWQRLASQTEGIYRFAATDASIKIPDIIGNYQIVDGVCDSFPMVDVNHIVTGEAANGSIAVALNPNIQIRYDEITDVATLTTFLQDKYIAYKLKTPTTSSVTPTNLPIKSLSGYNYIESSTGEMEIDYITDAYQNFVDTVESALPNTTRNLLSASKGGVKAFDIFKTLDEPKKPEASAEESKPEEKETEEGAKK